jgi:hypothetical protein
VRAETALYRDLGREFQRLRDAQAQTATLKKLTKRFFEKRKPPIVVAAHRVLAAEVQSAQRALAQKDRCEAVLASLGDARERVVCWKLDGYRWKDLRAALHRSYRRAHKAWRHAAAEPKTRSLHHWRSRTKDLFYHISLCQGAAPDFMEELAGELEVLGEFLGDDHDLVVLRALLERHPGDILAGPARDAFFKMLTLRREELLGAAFDLAGRVFLESPGEFIDALEARRDQHRQRRKKARRMAEHLAAQR